MFCVRYASREPIGVPSALVRDLAYTSKSSRRPARPAYLPARVFAPLPRIALRPNDPYVSGSRRTSAPSPAAKLDQVSSSPASPYCRSSSLPVTRSSDDSHNADSPFSGPADKVPRRMDPGVSNSHPRVPRPEEPAFARVRSSPCCSSSGIRSDRLGRLCSPGICPGSIPN